MATHTSHSCDYCGQAILDDDRRMITIHANGTAHNPDHPFGRDLVMHAELGTYHASEEQPCWAEMLDRISLIHDVSSKLGLAAGELEARRGLTRSPARPRREAASDALEQHHREWRERRRAWKQAPWETREGWLLEVLGDDELPVGELAERLNAKLGTPGDDATIYPENVASPGDADAEQRAARTRSGAGRRAAALPLASEARSRWADRGPRARIPGRRRGGGVMTSQNRAAPCRADERRCGGR